MIAPFNSIIKSEEIDFEEYLRKLHLFEIFKPVWEEFPDKELFKGIVKFIAYGYSMDSDMLFTSGNTWSKLSIDIYEKVGLPDDSDKNDGIYNSVVNLKSDSVRLSIEKWLMLQNEDNFIQFCHYRDLRKEFLSLSLSDMKKNTGEIDIEAKMKAALYSKELLKMMEDARDGFIQNHPKLRGSVDALNKASNNSQHKKSVGSYAVR